MTGRTRRRPWGNYCASRFALMTLAALPYAAQADDAATQSLAETAREHAARAAARVWHDARDLGQFALGLIGVGYRYSHDYAGADVEQRHFNGARRLVGVLPSLIPAVIPEASAITLTTISAESTAEEPVDETRELPGNP